MVLAVSSAGAVQCAFSLDAKALPVGLPWTPAECEATSYNHGKDAVSRPIIDTHAPHNQA